MNLNKLLKSYCNMLLYRIKILFKRRRHNKSRYSANKLYVSRAEVKHTNTKLLITLYTYNKQKLSIERYLRKIMLLIRFYRFRNENETKITVTHRNRILNILKLYTVYKKVTVRKKNDKTKKILFTFTNRLIHLIKDKFFVLKK